MCAPVPTNLVGASCKSNVGEIMRVRIFMQIIVVVVVVDVVINAEFEKYFIYTIYVN